MSLRPKQQSLTMEFECVKRKSRALVLFQGDNLSFVGFIFNQPTNAREYLEYNQYYNAASVFVTESGQPSEPPFDRKYIERRLQIQSGSGS